MPVDQDLFRRLISNGIAEGAARALADSGIFAPTASPSGVSFVIEGGGAVITVGFKGFIEIPYAGTITAWRLLGDQAGSIVVDIWRDTYANYPPVVGDSIVSGAKPTIAAATKGQGLGLSIAVAAGDILGFNVDSVATLTRVTAVLAITKA